MNEQTRQLIESLAAKMGTTAERLWAVLVKQAPIEAGVSFITFCFFICLLILGYKLIKEKTKEFDFDSPERILSWVLWAFWVTLWVILFACNLSAMIAGFLNPEYWALMKILQR